MTGINKIPCNLQDNNTYTKLLLEPKKRKDKSIMIFAYKLLDSFINKLDSNTKSELYDLAYTNFDEALAKSALYYHQLFEDYPSGIVLDLLIKHLKDKIFQQTNIISAATA